jgi:major membrane immunogen (membrane-anchored lipoprotein)
MKKILLFIFCSALLIGCGSSDSSKKEKETTKPAVKNNNWDEGNWNEIEWN